MSDFLLFSTDFVRSPVILRSNSPNDMMVVNIRRPIAVFVVNDDPPMSMIWRSMLLEFHSSTVMRASFVLRNSRSGFRETMVDIPWLKYSCTFCPPGREENSLYPEISSSKMISTRLRFLNVQYSAIFFLLDVVGVFLISGAHAGVCYCFHCFTVIEVIGE